LGVTDKREAVQKVILLNSSCLTLLSVLRQHLVTARALNMRLCETRILLENGGRDKFRDFAASHVHAAASCMCLFKENIPYLWGILGRTHVAESNFPIDDSIWLPISRDKHENGDFSQKMRGKRRLKWCQEINVFLMILKTLYSPNSAISP
jgi:hypothetical protein